MEDLVMDTVNCLKCGASRPPELAQGTERPPCPYCGERLLSMSMTIISSLNVSSQFSTGLFPANQSRDWKQRWKLIQNEIQIILCSHTTTRSGDAIHSSMQRLCSFFISCYHLKDALKAAARDLGLKPSDIESAVTEDARLAILADLANLDKHVSLTRSPRSGTIPSIESISGVDDLANDGWKLSARIIHGESILDGLVVAREAVNAWQEWLKTWRLI